MGNSLEKKINKKYFFGLLYRIETRFKQISGFCFYGLVLFVLMTLAFNSQIWRMGYYFDDWEAVYLQQQLFSARQIWNYFLIDRPLISIPDIILNPIMGTSPFAWRILEQFLAWAAILILVKMLLLIWPKHVMEIGWIGILLAVYPGISTLVISRTYFRVYISLLLFSISLLLMVMAVLRSRHKLLLTSFAVIFGIVQVLITEYYAGMELIRILLIFYISRQNNSNLMAAIRKTIKNWIPYITIFAIFLVYRFAILPVLQSDGIQVDNRPILLAQLLADPLNTIVRTFEIILQDLTYAVLYIWSQIFAPQDLDLNAKSTLMAWAIGFFAAFLGALTVETWHRKVVRIEIKTPFMNLILFMCLVTILLGGLPVWITGRQVITGTWSDRFLLGIVLGAVPLFVILIVWLIGQPRRNIQNIFLAIILAGSISYQFRLTNKFALNWDIQRDYYYQLKWRAPGLKPNTFILAPRTPFNYSADYEIAYAITLLYEQGNPNEQARYWWYDGPDDVIDYSTSRYPSGGSIVTSSFRSITFKSDMRHALPVLFLSNRCLQVVDPVYQLQPGLPEPEQELFTVNHSGLILDNGLQVDTSIYGEEPEHGWCYYFQKADFARSQQNWLEIMQLWDEVERHQLRVKFGVEYLPYIEASLHTGKPELALELTIKANQTKEMQPFLCASWSRIINQLPATIENQSTMERVSTQLNCSNYS